MFTTGTSLVILAIYLSITNQGFISNETVFEIFGANIVINFGLYLRFKFEIRNAILEFLVNVSYIIIVLLVFGNIFDWYSAVPVWFLSIMAVVIYIFAVIITIVKIQKDAKEINELLRKRKKKMDNSAT